MSVNCDAPFSAHQCSGEEVFRGMHDVGYGGRGRGASSRGSRGGFGGPGRSFDSDDRKRRASGGCSVKVRGLPYSTTEHELAAFFADYDVSRQGRGVYMMSFVLGGNCRGVYILVVVFGGVVIFVN